MASVNPPSPLNFRHDFLSLYQVHRRFGVPRNKVYAAAKKGSLRIHPDLKMTTEIWVLDWLGLTDDLAEG